MVLIDDFIYLFVVAMLCDLKSKLLLMDANECMSSMKNLEGLIDVANCVKFAVMMSRILPKAILNLKTRKEQDEAEYKKDYYKQRPWEIPRDLVEMNNARIFEISVEEMSRLRTKPLIIDVRPEKE